MAENIEIKNFDFKVCPWCGAEYKDRQVLRAQSDDAGPHILFVQCDGCETVYTVQRLIRWRAWKVINGKPLSRKEVASE